MRWRPRFTLRTLLIATGILGLLFGWLGTNVARIHRQRHAVAALQALGFNVYYDYELDGGKLVAGKTPFGWKPFRLIAGDDAFSTVVAVQQGTASPRTTDSDLSILGQLPELTDIWLGGRGITDEGAAS